jgi:hypothetical protein
MQQNVGTYTPICMVTSQKTGIFNGTALGTVNIAPNRVRRSCSPFQYLPQVKGTKTAALRRLVIGLVTGLLPRRPRFSPRPSMWDLCFRQSFFSSTSVFPSQYHSTNAPHSFIHLSATLYGFSNLQRHYTTFYKIGNVHTA